jgi:hypothetical protein
MSPRRASAERPPQPQEAENKEKPHLKVIEGGKGKRETPEPAISEAVRNQIERGDTLREQVRDLKREFLEAETPEERANLVTALEKIEAMLRRQNKEWQIITASAFPEPSKAVEDALEEIRTMEAEPRVIVAPEYAKEAERVERGGAKPWEIQETLVWEELQPGWEKDAKAAAEDLKKEGTPEEKALAAELLANNELPPRTERDLTHEARKLEHEAERAMREVESLEAQLDGMGVNTDDLAVSAAARAKLALRTLVNRKLRDLMRRYDMAVTRAEELDEEAKITKLAESDPARFNKVMNARIARTSALRARMERRDAAFDKVMQQVGSAPRTG